MLQKTWDDSLLLTRCWTISSFHRFFNCEDERNTELDSEESDIQWFYNLNSLVWWHKRENPTGKESQWGPRPHWASDVWGLCTMCWLECHLKMVSHNSITLQVWHWGQRVTPASAAWGSLQLMKLHCHQQLSSSSFCFMLVGHSELPVRRFMMNIQRQSHWNPFVTTSHLSQLKSLWFSCKMVLQT